MFDNFWLATIILPLFAILLKSEISDLYASWTVFKSRDFDEDRDPNTPDSCQIYEPATGQWHDVLISHYSFSLNKNKRGVFVFHPIDGKLGVGKDWAAERISLLQWDRLRKRKIPTPLDSNLEQILVHKFADPQ